jgi:hypothetical protein
MKVGDLVRVKRHIDFYEHATQKIINIAMNEIGIIIQKKGDACSVLFSSLDNDVKSFLEKHLEVISENN